MRNYKSIREPVNPIEAEKIDLLVEMARLYYEEDLTQAEIAKRLKVSKATVSRALKEAHQNKLVEVVIHYPISTEPALASALVERFNLKEAYVLAGSHRDYKSLVQSVGQLAARVVEKYLRDGTTLAVSLGQAVAATVESLQIIEPMHIRITSTHGQSDKDLIEGSSVIRTLASLFGNDVRIIPSPLMLKNEEICHVVKQEHAVREALDLAEHADLALVGIGAPNPEVSALLLNKYVKLEDLQRLAAEGAVGDVCAVQFDDQGNILDVDMNRRIVTIDILRLRDIPVVIGVSAGMPKANAILGALRGHYVNILVTDANVARYLLSI
jgi:DNA-binding transcriptional regulator LsrR (DeoR family)